MYYAYVCLLCLWLPYLPPFCVECDVCRLSRVDDGEAFHASTLLVLRLTMRYLIFFCFREAFRYRNNISHGYLQSERKKKVKRPKRCVFSRFLFELPSKLSSRYLKLRCHESLKKKPPFFDHNSSEILPLVVVEGA